MLSRIALLASLLFLVVASGCDSGSDDNDNGVGSFEAAVSGDATATLRGQAAFATETEDDSTYMAIGLVDDEDPQDLIVLVVPGTPRSGTFDVNNEEAGGLFTLTNGDEGTFYIVQSGTLTVTRANDRRVEGRFEVEAVSLVDETDEVSIEGTFEAEPGEVEDSEF